MKKISFASSVTVDSKPVRAGTDQSKFISSQWGAPLVEASFRDAIFEDGGNGFAIKSTSLGALGRVAEAHKAPLNIRLSSILGAWVRIPHRKLTFIT